MVMMKKGSTSQGVVLRIIDASDGTPETGVVFNTAGIDLWFRRENAFSVDITEAVLTTPDLEDTWETGGFLHINDGYYRLDVPDAAFASAAGVDHVMIGGTVTGMIVIGVWILLTDFDPQDVLRAGLTALPPAAADAAGGLVISDDGGLDIDEIKVATDKMAFTVANQIDANVLAISGDTVAADNLELQYDTNGLTGGKFPANQDQVGAIGTSGGAALNFAAADDNVDGALNGVTFVGTQTSGTFVSTEAEQGTYHIITNVGNNIDILYEFNIGGGRTATEIIWKGYLSPNGSSVNVQMYDFIGMDWETRATITGKNQSVNETLDFPVLSKHTGTGANIGIVYVRFIVASGSSQVLNTDELITEAVSIGQSVGYSNGRIWVDTATGTAGTESFINGTADNAVLTWADALTLSSQTGLTDFQIINGSTIQLSAASTNYSLFGDNWTLDLNGQNVSGSHFEGAVVSGVCTNTTGEQTFQRCEIGNVTFPTNTHFRACDLAGTATVGEAGNYFFDNCHHGTTSGLAIIDFGAALNASTIHMHPFNGGVEIRNMGAGTGTYFLHINGAGAITFNANCSATSTINLSGNWALTNNASGLTINDDGHVSQTTINTQVDLSWTTQMADSVPSDGTISTREQATYQLLQLLSDFSISGTTMTVFKVDGSTTLITLTLDDGTNPTSITRAT